MPHRKKPSDKSTAKPRSLTIELTLDEPNAKRFLELIADGTFAKKMKAVGIGGPRRVTLQEPGGKVKDWRQTEIGRQIEEKNDGITGP